MSKYKTWVPGLTFVIIAAMVILGCSAPGSGGPSRADVAKAIVAMNYSWDYAYYDGTYTGPVGGQYTSTMHYSVFSGGSVSATYTSTTNPGNGAFAIDGIVTFTDYHEPLTGYTVNGTMAVSISSNVSLSDIATYPQTLNTTCTCDLTLSGGSISRLTGNL